MNRFRILVGFLRTLVGLPERTSPWFGIGRSTMNDIERARWKRGMRESAEHGSDLIRRYMAHLNAGGDAIEFMLAEFPEHTERPKLRPALVSPEEYRAMLARSGAP